MFSSDVDLSALLALVLCAIALFGFAKWATRLSEANQFKLPEEPGFDPLTQQQSLFATSAATPADSGFAPEAELGPVRITKFYFSKFDLLHGPADPYAFYDELFVELFDAGSGHRWTQSYGVATPQGLAQILDDKSWFYLYANGIVVVQKYDRERIRQAVVARIAEENELFKPQEKLQEEAL